MKLKTILILSIFSIKVNAQITIQKDDFAAPNEWYVMGTDTIANATTVEPLLAGGANKTWNINGLFNTHTKDTSFFENGFTYPTAPAGCNLVQYTKDPITAERQHTYFFISDAELKVFFDGSGDTPIPGMLKLLKFPSTYLTDFSDSIQTALTTLAEDFGIPSNPLIDSARMEIKILTNSLMDGWGKLVMGANTVDVLRQKSSITFNIKFFVRNKITGQYSIFQGFPEQNSTSFVYNWIGKNSGLPYLSFGIDEIGELGQNVECMLYSSRGFANRVKDVHQNLISVAYPNPASDIVNLELDLKQSGEGSLKIFNLAGTEVLVKDNVALFAGKETIGVSVGGLPAGMYLYQIKTKEGIFKGKIIKK